ncbi:hypothetical protein [Novipirellula caenicola]
MGETPNRGLIPAELKPVCFGWYRVACEVVIGTQMASGLLGG